MQNIIMLSEKPVKMINFFKDNPQNFKQIYYVLTGIEYKFLKLLHMKFKDLLIIIIFRNFYSCQMD